MIEIQNLGFDRAKQKFNNLYYTLPPQKFNKGYFEISEQFGLYFQSYLRFDEEVKDSE